MSACPCGGRWEYVRTEPEGYRHRCKECGKEVVLRWIENSAEQEVFYRNGTPPGRAPNCS